ncbi:hypothetical protein Tco_1036750 [Tanacetum coccineum]
MFTRSLVIQKRVEDLQLGVESYQKKINVTKPDTTRLDLRKSHPYTPNKDPQGFIYVDDYKRNRLMRSDKLYKFSDGTLTRLLSSLEDIVKNINMEYLPKRRWSTLEKKRAHFMIKDINKLLKERRMMRSLEKFVGGRLYETDLRLLQRTIRSRHIVFISQRFNTTAGNLVKKILLKLNLSDHRSILTDSKEYLKMVMERQSVKAKEIQERCIIKAFQYYQIKQVYRVAGQSEADTCTRDIRNGSWHACFSRLLEAIIAPHASIIMEEYMELEAKKARRRGQEFNSETVKYGKVRYFEDIDYFKDFENEFMSPFEYESYYLVKGCS